MTRIDELIAKPMPDKDSYATTELELSPRWTRATYYQATGQQAPPYDPNRQIKRWADRSALGPDAQARKTYNVLRPTPDGMLKFTSMALIATEAGTFNLPGTYSYEKYVVKPTTAFVQGTDGQRSSINPEYLSTMQEAQDFAHAIGGLSTYQKALDGPFTYYYPPEESRRPWIVTWKDKELQASFYIAQRNKQGIGSPGEWDLSGEAPLWKTAIPTDQPMDNRPEIEMPVRDLELGKEEFRCTPFGCAVWRIDRAPAPGTGTAAALTPADHEQLNRIEKTAGAILRLVAPMPPI